MEEKDFKIIALENKIKELEETNKKLLQRIIDLTISYVALSENFYK